MRMWSVCGLLALLSLSCSGEVTTPDTTPPGAVTNLSVQTSTPGLLLRWTAPGDDGARGRVSGYDIRYTAGNLAGEWDSATAIPFPYRPESPGSIESFVFTSNLQVGTWEFGLKAADDVSNWSELSNIARITIVAPDTIPPASVSDLSLNSITRSTVSLRWTATGDDGLSGQASMYDLRYAHGPITAETWADATPAGVPVTPRASGELEGFTVTDLNSGQEYWFALRVADEAGNWSDRSNSVSAFVAFDGPAQLTFDQTSSGAYGPDWSPDGRSIVFVMSAVVGPGMTRPQIHVIPAGGGEPIQYTWFTPEGAQSPIWSQDGGRFYFLKYVTVQEIYTKSVLAGMDADPGADYTVLASYGLENVGSISLSPDGSRIAYMVGTSTPGQPIVMDIYTISTTGSEARQLVADIPASGLDWSPDGTKLVYSMKQDGIYNLWVMPSNGGDAAQVTTGAENKWSPAWSPDGSEIAYIADGSIWAIPSLGGEPRRITTDTSGISGRLSWSPDGTKIAYEKTVNQLRNIWIAPVD